MSSSENENTFQCHHSSHIDPKDDIWISYLSLIRATEKNQTNCQKIFDT